MQRTAGQTGGQPPPPPPPPPPPAEQPPAAPSDRAVDLSEPDFTLIGLPTTLRMPKCASAFRVTHRFTRSLAQGNFGDLLADAFSTRRRRQLGSSIAGLLSGTRWPANRTERQDDSVPRATSAASAKRQGAHRPRRGLHHRRQEQLSGELLPFDWRRRLQKARTSRRDLRRADLGQQHQRAAERSRRRQRHLHDRSRRPGTDSLEAVLVAETAPRFRPTRALRRASGIEMRAGGHSFQISFSDGFGTTMAQMARGGFDSEDWYLGFNISRKFSTRTNPLGERHEQQNCEMAGSGIRACAGSQLRRLEHVAVTAT